MLKKFIGNREFYSRTLAVAVPIIIQNGITSFVNLLDNIMVGQVGTEAMTGVAITNQLIFVFNLCIFGAVSGAGIFGAQFYGKKDYEGVRNTFRYKLVICGVIVSLALVLFTTHGVDLISLFLTGEGNAADIAMALEYGKRYLQIICIGLIPFGLIQVYSGTLREAGETVIPMKASVTAVLVNFVGNYVLIFGKFGAPQLGAEGAAIATTLSRFVECAITMVYSHTHVKQFPFLSGLYRHFRIPTELAKRIFIKGTPILINEALFSTGLSYQVQCYSVRGYAVVSAFNISQTVSMLFNIVTMAMGSAIAIMVGQALGTGDMQKARDEDNKLIALTLASCVVIGAIMAAVAPLIPHAYNVSDEVRSIASSLLIISAICMPLRAFANACYFTLRAGGKTLITFIFDSGSIWVLSVPLALVLTHFTTLPIIPLYFCCSMIELLKCVIGFIFLKSGMWLNDLTKI